MNRRQSVEEGILDDQGRAFDALLAMVACRKFLQPGYGWEMWRDDFHDYDGCSRCNPEAWEIER